MISPDARRILDQAGVELARVVYIKQLEVSRLPRDADLPVQFSGGTVRLGELDGWLREKDAQRDKRESFIVGAIADIVAAVFRVLTFFR